MLGSLLKNRDYKPKNLAISALAVALFWSNLPQRTAGVNAGLAVVAYVVLAWADNSCDCESDEERNNYL